MTLHTSDFSPVFPPFFPIHISFVTCVDLEKVLELIIVIACVVMHVSH